MPVPQLALYDDDPYRRLRPPAPTPYRHLCTCTGARPVKLMLLEGYNPVSCMECNLEVAPEMLGFPKHLANEIADWRAHYAALDHLWLRGPAPYRRWAARELANIESPVNQQGLVVRARLELYRRCYYWIFGWANGRLVEVTQCPACAQPMAPYDGYHTEWWVCEPCGLVADASE
jgi:hypothetical protein